MEKRDDILPPKNEMTRRHCSTKNFSKPRTYSCCEKKWFGVNCSSEWRRHSLVVLWKNAVFRVHPLNFILKNIYCPLHGLYFIVHYFSIICVFYSLNTSSISTIIHILLYFIQLTSSLSFSYQLPSFSFILLSNHPIIKVYIICKS
jgi:hypothetical protein